ncbi:MAG TPA: ATP synthase F0 subunit B [Smithellaceae bacterium]|nr:ATP synthase F0 subunit B [Smithellaceae bacterium]HRS83249.1 ATP synthase F0 subunit B [Smithellaceae bacterium]HRV44010.1 ATP synthase F0 subunit B [Smithellaceae bacterium]
MKSSFRSFSFSILLSPVFVLACVALAFASGGGEGGHSASQWKDFAWKTFNALLIIGFLVYLLAPKIKGFFAGRRQEIKESLENATAQKAEAEKQYREYAEKIDKASQEIDGIFEMIKAQGVVEKEKIIEDAQKVAQKMKEDAQARIEQELKKASGQLRAEAVALSVQMAEEILKKNITAQDHEAMVREYMDKVVNKH